MRPLVAMLALSCASAHDAVSPIEGVGGEALEVQQSLRVRTPGERTPSAKFVAQSGGVVVDVVRAAPNCAPAVEAVVRKGGGILDVITTIYGFAFSSCAVGAEAVLTYRTTIPHASSGPVVVRLFERVGEETPTFRAQATVVVPR